LLLLLDDEPESSTLPTARIRNRSKPSNDAAYRNLFFIITTKPFI